VLSNITLASRHVFKVSRDEATTRALELLDRVGLADKAQEYPDRLSGGQQQRLALVRAIANEPEVLLLDEITSALDPELVSEVLDLVTDLKNDGTTIVMATHEMAFARDVADQIVFLDQGLVAEQGPPAQVFGAPREARTREFLQRFRGGN
jgi:polar amino acid transport system ATP-binding protein